MGENTPNAATLLATTDGPILLFDGVCTLCNGVVRFVASHDSRRQVSFAPLDSPPGRALLDRFGLATDETDSVVLIEADRASVKSTAALRLARYLDEPWPFLARLRVVPRPVRDVVYDAVAATRYSVFGRKDRCPVPDAGVRDRFLDGAFADRAE